MSMDRRRCHPRVGAEAAAGLPRALLQAMALLAAILVCGLAGPGPGPAAAQASAGAPPPPGNVPLPPSSPDPTKYRIAVMANNVGSTPAAVYASVRAQWAPTFEAYLNSEVGIYVNKTFEIIPMDVSTNDLTQELKTSHGNATFFPSSRCGHSVTAIQAWNILSKQPAIVDAFLANPSTIVCAQAELRARPLLSIVQLRHGADSEGSGATFLTAYNSSVKGLSDLSGRTVVIGDPFGNLNTQYLWAQLKAQGTYLWDAPARVVQASSISVLMPEILSGKIDLYAIRPDFLDSWNANVLKNPVTLAGLGWNLTGPNANVRFVDATYTFPDYPFPSSTPQIPDWGLVAMPGADETVTQLIMLALQKLNRSMPAALAGGFSRFTYNYDYSSSYRVLGSIGLLNEDGTCLKGTSTLQNIYTATQCPTGKYKLSFEEVTGSCTTKGLGCPWSGAVCVCSPCAVVPAEQVAVYVSVGAAATAAARGAANNSAPPGVAASCSKLAVCSTVRQRDEVMISVVDLYGPTLRAQLGLAAITNVEYVYTTSLRTTNATQFTPLDLTLAWGVGGGPPGAGGLWQFLLPQPQLGFLLLLVRVDGAQIASSPTVLEGVAPTCPGSQVPQPDGTCNCAASIWGAAVGLDALTCEPLFSVPGLIGGVAGAGLLAVLLTARLWKRLDESWRIDYSSLVFPEREEVIGKGAFGVVCRAQYRGSIVAVKKGIPLKSGAGGRHGGTASSASSASVSASSSPLAAFKKDDPHKGSIDKQGNVPVAPARIRRMRSTHAVPEHLPTPGVLRHANMAGGLRGLRHRSVATGMSASTGLISGNGTPRIHPAPMSSVMATGTMDGMGSGLASRGASSAAAAPSWWNLVFKASHRSALREQKTDFIDEIRYCVRLRHNKIVTVLGGVLLSSKEGSLQPLLLMEYCALGSLADLLVNVTVQLTPDAMVAIVADVCAGMQFLHLDSPPVLHKDIKAANVLITQQLEAKIADFGLSFKTAGGTGSPFWMAPEVLRGQISTPASDVYSFGILLYELWARAEPYSDIEGSAHDILTQIADADIGAHPQWALRPHMPPSVPAFWASLMRRCTDANPDRRPTFAEISNEIKAQSRHTLVNADAGRGGAPSDATFRSLSVAELHRVRQHRDPWRRMTSPVLHDGGGLLPEADAGPAGAGAGAAAATRPRQHVALVHIELAALDVHYAALSSSNLAALVDLLERLYAMLDELAFIHDLFPVPTVTESHLCVAGLLEGDNGEGAVRRAAAFASAAAAAAVKFLAPGSPHAEPPLEQRGLLLGGADGVELRVACHCGPVTSCVVGHESRLCLVGPTMSVLAALREAAGPGQILLSQDAAIALAEQAPDLAANLGPPPAPAQEGYELPAGCHLLEVPLPIPATGAAAAGDLSGSAGSSPAAAEDRSLAPLEEGDLELIERREAGGWDGSTPGAGTERAMFDPNSWRARLNGIVGARVHGRGDAGLAAHLAVPRHTTRLKWAALQAELPGVGIEFFRLFFVAVPEGLSFFPCRDDARPLDSPLLRHKAQLMMCAIGSVITSYDDQASRMMVNGHVRRQLVKLGRRHRNVCPGRTVSPAQVQIACMCLTQAFRSKLGAAWSASMAAALHWALQIVGSAMIEGLNDRVIDDPADDFNTKTAFGDTTGSNISKVANVNALP